MDTQTTETIVLNNRVVLKGAIDMHSVRPLENKGDSVIAFEIRTMRESLTTDTISCIARKDLFEDLKENMLEGGVVEFYGSFRSRNWQDLNGRTHLQLYVNVEEVFSKEATMYLLKDVNEIHLKGTICKTPLVRKTPGGRVITDICLAVNRDNSKKSDYIPCIGWNKGAKLLGELKVGDKLYIEGRIQSRDYIKRTEDGQQIEKRAYEVSIKKFNVDKE